MATAHAIAEKRMQSITQNKVFLAAVWVDLGKVVENKPASSLVVSLGKALNGMPHLYVEDR